MNPKLNTHPLKTCSCSSCVYQPKGPGETILYGSKVDKLYYEKYLPLRERKLLEKLVRTRGVYDDIRNRLILSSVDVSNDPDYAETHSPNFETNIENKNSVVHNLVDLVDRGEYSPNSSVNLHSACCRCCICSSKIRLPKQSKVCMHIPDPEHINQYLESHKGKMNKGTKKVEKYQIETRKVNFRGARSDRCLCTLKFNVNPKNNIPQHTSKPSKVIETNKCKCPYEAVKPSFSQKSIALAKNAETKLRESIRSSASKIATVFRIKKDSLAIFRDKLKKKQAMKAWECESNFCIVDKCIPEECYKEKIKKRANNHYSADEQRARKVSFHPPREKHNSQRLLTRKTGLVICDCKVKTKSETSMTEIVAPQPELPEKKQRAKKQLPFPRECEPLMCTPGECDPRECTKILLKSAPARHKLERCFCTKQLREPQITNPQKKSKRVRVEKFRASKSTMTTKRNESLAEKPAPVIIFKPKINNLLPYECKPSTCIPSYCDPLVCEKRIQQRHLGYNKDRNTMTLPQKTKITSVSSSKSVYRKAQTRVRKIRTPKLKQQQTPRTEKSNSSPDAPRKQAVRISSSFSFDIEFFKEKNFPGDLGTANRANNNKRKISKQHVIDQYSKPTQNKSLSELNVHPQNIFKLGRSNQALLDPFFKRCFCTLKQNKSAKQKPMKRRPKNKMSITADQIKGKKKEIVTCKCKKMSVHSDSEPDTVFYKSKASMTMVNYELPPPNLLPYECEPLFCTPGQCDPIICERRIRTRNLKKPKIISKEVNSEPKGMETHTIASKSATSSYSARKIQLPKRKKVKTKTNINTKSYTIPRAEKSKSAPNAPQRQAVRISSNFSFGIEFYKDIAPPNDNSTIQDKDDNKENRPKAQKNVSQVNEIIKSKLTITAPLKRCFCTLKFQKKPKPEVKQLVTKKITTKETEEAEDILNIGEFKNISTQTKKLVTAQPLDSVRPPLDLLPYECEPNFCIPGKCNPLICDKRIKQRNNGSKPLLKRCFCTLKFHRNDNTSVRSIGIETNKMKHHNKPLKLLHYEREPRIRNPDFGNSLEYKNFAHKRNMFEASNQTDSEIHKRSISSETKYFVKAKKSKSSRRRVPEKDNYVTRSERPYVNTPDSVAKSRHAITFGSNINFNIEFYKNKVPRRFSSPR